MTGAWLTIIGCLPDGSTAPGVDAGAAIGAAESVFGPDRLLAAARVPRIKCRPWPRPLHAGIEMILAGRGHPIVVLATGDPMHFGVGRTLAERVPLQEMRVFPAPSAFSLAAARLGWPLEEVECLSLHRKAGMAIAEHLAPGRRLIALSRDGATPAEAAQALVEAGYGSSALSVLEAMGSDTERRFDRSARSVAGRGCRFADLNTLAIACVADADIGARASHAASTILPDSAYSHDGQLTKHEVRAITMAALGPHPDAHLWDVGAGCGSIAIEWLRLAPGSRATAFERSAARCAMIRQNADRHGAARLIVAEGDSHDRVNTAAPPDTIFLGGAVADDGLFDALWTALPAGGRFVSNAVTLAGEQASIGRYRRFGGELIRIALDVAEPIGETVALRPKMPVLQWRGTKAAA